MDRLPPGIAAVILAAGRSSRMQENESVPDPARHKALFPFPERPLLEMQVENYLAAGVSTVVIVLGWQAGFIQREISTPSQVEIVINQDWELGMFSSVRTGLTAASTTADLFLQPVDVPPPSYSTMQQLLLRTAEKGIAMPVYREQGGHPLFMRAGIRKQILEFPPNDRLDRIIREELQSEVHRVKIGDPGCLNNLNTPPEWKRFRENGHNIPDTG